MKYLKKYESFDDDGSFIDDSGNLQFKGTDVDAEVEREEQLEQFNKDLKDFVGKEFTFDSATNVYTWTSDSENDKGKMSHDTKTYRLKKVIPDRYLMSHRKHKPQIFFKLIFVTGKWPNSQKLIVQLDRNTPMEIIDTKAVKFYEWSKYSIHRGGDFEKKKTFPRTSTFVEYVISDYPTLEKMKDLQQMIIEIEKSLHEED